MDLFIYLFIFILFYFIFFFFFLLFFFSISLFLSSFFFFFASFYLWQIRLWAEEELQLLTLPKFLVDNSCRDIKINSVSKNLVY